MTTILVFLFLKKIGGFMQKKEFREEVARYTVLPDGAAG